jgi:hypothetical protein
VTRGGGSAFFLSLPIAILVASPTSAAADVELLPDVSVRLEGSRYAPSEEAFVWDTWIGGGAGVLRLEAATAYLTADVETILGRERRAFDANQVGYHLEAGVRVAAGRHVVVPFFHHVSRHVVDRPKTELVDWNLVGIRVAGRFPAPFSGNGRYSASVGHTVEWRAVGYEWEVEGVVDLEFMPRPWGGPYLGAQARFVTVDPGGRLSRGDFVDFLGEGGVRYARGGRSLDLFVAYEHRNDVFVLVPGVRNRALFGVRGGFASVGDARRGFPVGGRLGRP